MESKDLPATHRQRHRRGERDLYLAGLRASINNKDFTRGLVAAYEQALASRCREVQVTCKSRAEAVYGRVVTEVAALEGGDMAWRDGWTLELRNGSCIVFRW